MLNISGEARFADVVEQVLYNSALSSIGLDGTSFFYTNTMRQVTDLPFELRMDRMRQPFLGVLLLPTEHSSHHRGGRWICLLSV